MKDNNIFKYHKNQNLNKKEEYDLLHDKLIKLGYENDNIYQRTEYDMDFGSVLVKVVIGCN